MSRISGPDGGLGVPSFPVDLCSQTVQPPEFPSFEQTKPEQIVDRGDKC